MNKINPTEEQQAIIQSMKSPASAMVKSYAGCAKTTTLALAGTQIKSPALALAFNKSIATELAPRLGSNFTVKTINGFGFAAWTRANPQISKWTIDEKKTGKLISQIAKEQKLDLDSDQWMWARELVTRAQQWGVVPSGTGLVEDTEETWREIAESLWIPASDFVLLYDIARQALVKSNDLARTGIISFDDQVYCPTVLGGKFPQFPIMFLDEAQDLTPLNHQMINLSLRADAKLLAVGDPKQAIYLFRGSDARSMEKIRGLRPEWVNLPLRMTFRCPRVVVERNLFHAPGFQAGPNNPEGEFLAWNRQDEDEGILPTWDWKDIVEFSAYGGEPSRAILCRNNAPLLALAFKLIRDGIGVQMLGRDIGKGLIAISRKIIKEDSTPRDICAGLISDWQEREVSLARTNGQDERIAGIDDRAECLQAVLTHAETQDAGSLRMILERLFSRQDGLVTLSTIHKAKGKEWDLVLHLDPWRIPSKSSRKLAERGFPEQLEQEYNLKYVAETRTKNTLINANLEDYQSK